MIDSSNAEKNNPSIRKKTKPKIPDYKSTDSLPIQRKERPSVDTLALAKLIEDEVGYVRNLNNEGM